MFIVLLSFSESLATKCLFLNDEPCMLRPNLININPNMRQNQMVILKVHQK